MLRTAPGMWWISIQLSLPPAPATMPRLQSDGEHQRAEEEWPEGGSPAEDTTRGGVSQQQLLRTVSAATCLQLWPGQWPEPL